jgi:hypothetical protein
LTAVHHETNCLFFSREALDTCETMCYDAIWWVGAAGKEGIMRKKTATFIRSLVGAYGKPYPIVEVPGCEPPGLLGDFGHFVNASGELIRYPNAYRRGWGKPIYVASTVRIEVGALWVRALEHLGLDCPLGIVADYALDSEGVTS